MEHTDAEARAIWADQDSMPDVLNQEPQSVCTVEDFDVIKPNGWEAPSHEGNHGCLPTILA